MYTMDNITVVDLAAEAVLQGEKAAFILLLVTSACFSNDSLKEY